MFLMDEHRHVFSVGNEFETISAVPEFILVDFFGNDFAMVLMQEINSEPLQSSFNKLSTSL